MRCMFVSLLLRYTLFLAIHFTFKRNNSLKSCVFCEYITMTYILVILMNILSVLFNVLCWQGFTIDRRGSSIKCFLLVRQNRCVELSLQRFSSKHRIASHPMLLPHESIAAIFFQNPSSTGGITRIWEYSKLCGERSAGRGCYREGKKLRERVITLSTCSSFFFWTRYDSAASAL